MFLRDDQKRNGRKCGMKVAKCEKAVNQLIAGGGGGGVLKQFLGTL